jgi:hypothetical protein
VAHGALDTAARKKTNGFPSGPGCCVSRWHAPWPEGSVPLARNVRRTLACLGTLLLAAPVSAQEAAVATSPPPADLGEPHADRVILSPTAYTHPRGTFFVSSYDLVLLQAGYALTDRTQLSVTASPPIGERGEEVRIAFVDATLKSALVRQGLVRAAALGSVSGAATSEGLLLIGRVGGVVQLCFQTNCHSSLSLSSTVLLTGQVVMASGVGAIIRAGRYLSFVAEVDTVIPLRSDGDSGSAILAGAGVRLHFQRFAMDLSFLGGTLPLPLLALTYRW